jgi:hypothetical protein
MALVGGATIVSRTGAGRHIVMIVSTRGNLCTGTALARDLVLTAGHCVAPAATYRVLALDAKPPGLPVQNIAVHPRYNPRDYAGGRVTADVALLKLETPLPADVVPAALGVNQAVKPGDRFVMPASAPLPGSEAGNGTARGGAIATGKPGNLQVRRSTRRRVMRARPRRLPAIRRAAFVGARRIRYGGVELVTAAGGGRRGATGVTPLALPRVDCRDGKKVNSAIAPKPEAPMHEWVLCRRPRSRQQAKGPAGSAGPLPGLSCRLRIRSGN